MRSRFEFDRSQEEGEIPTPLASSEAIDSPGVTSQCARFVVEESPANDSASSAEFRGDLETDAPQAAPIQPALLTPEPGNTWRNEVADRVNRYRARRQTRAPRYPSLTLKFDSLDSRAAARSLADSATRQSVAMDSAMMAQESVVTEPVAPAARVFAPTETGKLIAFPRSIPWAPRPLDELADPVVDRPRILEVPDEIPPPPALGGISMEPVEPKVEEKRPGFEIPLQPARMSRRIAAAALDGFMVLLAWALFAAMFFRVTAIVPPVFPALGMIGLLAAMLAMGYQFLLLVFTGTTPGLKVARLELRRFDGQPVPRRLRRWRLLASVLSGVSLGLGYAWCFLDEDQLCWHDRITRTYMAPKTSSGGVQQSKQTLGA